MASYDIKGLFTAVPVDPAIAIVKYGLQHDPSLPNRTSLSIPQIITLLEFYLKNTYFLFQGILHKSVGVPMGFPLSLAACSWKSLKPRPSDLLSTTLSLAQVHR